MYVGANAKLISSTLETHIRLCRRFGFSLLMKKTMLIGHCLQRNLGTQITTYSGLREKLPLEILIEFPRSRKCSKVLACNFRKFTTMEYCI
jgi:hypothetical protein